MENFWMLVRFEYKKIVQRKSVWVAAMLALGLIVLSTVAAVIGQTDSSDPDSMTNYEELMLYKEYDLALTGQLLDGDLIMDAAEAYATIPDNVYPYTDSIEYQTYAAPYSLVFKRVDSAYTNRNIPFGYVEMGALTQEQADSYYDIRIEQYRLNLENNPLFSQDNIERIISEDSQVEKPFVLAYSDGYQRNFGLSTSNIAVILLFLAFVCAPICSHEYQSGADALILTAKHGKGKTMAAKTVVMLSIAVVTTLISLSISYFGCMLVYGFEGGSASIQNYIPLLTYDFTMMDVTLLLGVQGLLSALLMTAITLFLSSLTKRTSLVLMGGVVIVLLDIAGVSPFLEKVRYFLPTTIGSVETVYTQLSFSLFGLDLWLYQAVGLMAVAVSIPLLWLAGRNFKRHQVT